MASPANHTEEEQQVQAQSPAYDQSIHFEQLSEAESSTARPPSCNLEGGQAPSPPPSPSGSPTRQFAIPLPEVIPDDLLLYCHLPYIRDCPFTLLIPKFHNTDQLSELCDENQITVKVWHVRITTIMHEILTCQNIPRAEWDERISLFYTVQIATLITSIQRAIGNFGVFGSQINEMGHFLDALNTTYFMAYMFCFVPSDGIDRNDNLLHKDVVQFLTKAVEHRAGVESAAFLQRLVVALEHDLIQARESMRLAVAEGTFVPLPIPGLEEESADVEDEANDIE